MELTRNSPNDDKESNQRVYKGNVLVVDDTKQNLDMLTTLLTHYGYLARPVPNGEMAIKACELDPPDLILLDI